MANLLQLLCILIFIGLVQSWTFPSYENSTSSTFFDDMNRMMARMHQNFERLFGLSFNPMENWNDDRQQLDAVEPVCTTTINPPPTSMSPQKVRRKKFRQTQTTTCTKELILNGKKQFYREVNVTDTQGHLLSQSKIYQTILFNNNTMPVDSNVISY